MSLSIPFVFGNSPKINQLNANFQAVANKFTEGVGGIVDGDCSSAMGLKGSKLSNVPGNRVPNDRLEDNSVDSRVLKSDTAAGSPNAGVALSTQIKDGIVTNSKLAPGTILAGVGKIQTYSKLCSTLFGINSLGFLATAVSTVENDATVAGRDKTKLIPLFCYVERAGGVPADYTDLHLKPCVQTRTGDNVIYFGVSNVHSSTSEDLTLYTLIFVYWSLT